MHSLKHGLSVADIHLWLTMLSSCCAWRLELAFKRMLGNKEKLQSQILLLWAPSFEQFWSSAGRATWTITKQEGHPDNTG